MRLFTGAIILLLLIVIFDFGEIIDQFRTVNTNWIYLVGLSILSSTIIGAVGMYLLVSRKNELVFFQFLPVYWMSWSIGLVVPGQVGDIASISYLLNRLGLEWKIILARSLVDKVISMLIILILAIYGLVFILKIDAITNEALVGSLAISALFLLIIVYKWEFIKNYLLKKKSKIIDFFHITTKEILHTVSRFPIRVFINSILTMLKVTLIGLAYWFMFKALGYSKLEFWDVLPLVAASSIIAYIPVSFNGIGTVELTGVLLFSTIGLPEAAIFTAYLLLRFTVFILAWVPASLILLFTKERTSNAFS